jgi:hypothetical protein
MALTTTVPILGKTRDDKSKPGILSRYDKCMGGVDNMDQLMMSKTVRIKSKRWPMSCLSFMLDTARVNARTIALIQDQRHVPDTRLFAKELVRELVTPHIQRRIMARSLQNHVHVKAQCYLGEDLRPPGQQDPVQDIFQDPAEDLVEEVPKPRQGSQLFY